MRRRQTINPTTPARAGVVFVLLLCSIPRSLAPSNSPPRVTPRVFNTTVGTDKCTVARNTFVECATPISSTGTHAIGPTVMPANIATATNPLANIVIA